MSNKAVWKVWCNQEAAFIRTRPLRGGRVPNFCPNNVLHTIDVDRRFVMYEMAPTPENFLVSRETGDTVVSREDGQVMVELPEE